jgi:hypothetical protein
LVRNSLNLSDADADPTQSSVSKSTPSTATPTSWKGPERKRES